jgi:hypothetical protein
MTDSNAYAASSPSRTHECAVCRQVRITSGLILHSSSMSSSYADNPNCMRGMASGCRLTCCHLAFGHKRAAMLLVSTRCPAPTPLDSKDVTRTCRNVMNSSIAATLELNASSISSMGMSPIRDCVNRTGPVPDTVVLGRSHSCVHPHSSNGSASPTSRLFLMTALTVSVAEGNSETTRKTGWWCAMATSANRADSYSSLPVTAPLVVSTASYLP